MKSSIKNLIIFGSLAVVSLAAFIAALYFSQTIPLIIVGSLTVAGFLAVFGVVLWHYVTGQPDFTTLDGTQVWTDDISYITKELMEDALDFYCTKVARSGLYGLTGMELLLCISDLKIKWSTTAVGAAGPGWIVDGSAGLQKGNVILVQDKGLIAESALFHELHHAVDELVLKIPPDYAHERKEWWDLIPGLKRGFLDKEKREDQL